MIRITNEKELNKIGLRIDPLDQNKAISIHAPLSPKPENSEKSDVGCLEDDKTLNDLWQCWKVVNDEVNAITREIKAKGLYKTALRWRSGNVLLAIKERVGHGHFDDACHERMVDKRRASEDMRIAENFPTEEDAGAFTVPQALKIIRNADDPRAKPEPEEEEETTQEPQPQEQKGVFSRIRG